MSHLTHYRSFQRRFYRSDDPTNSVIALKDHSHPGQGPIPQAQQTKRQRKGCNQKRFLHIASSTPKTQARSKPDPVNHVARYWEHKRFSVPCTGVERLVVKQSRRRPCMSVCVTKMSHNHSQTENCNKEFSSDVIINHHHIEAENNKSIRST